MNAESTRPKRTPFGTLARAIGVTAVIAFIALLTYGLLTSAPDQTIDDALARAETVPAPGFKLDILDAGRPPAKLRVVVERAAADGRLSLAELRGTPVVLNFWASWCDPCRQEAPVLERGWQRAGREGVLYVGLNMQDITTDARQFLREFDVSYPNVREPDDRTARRYGLTGLPETYFISAGGEVVSHVIGAIDDEQLRRGVAAARRGRPESTIEGGERQPTR